MATLTVAPGASYTYQADSPIEALRWLATQITLVAEGLEEGPDAPPWR